MLNFPAAAIKRPPLRHWWDFFYKKAAQGRNKKTLSHFLSPEKKIEVDLIGGKNHHLKKN
jgi:hypothetical protein